MFLRENGWKVDVKDAKNKIMVGIDEGQL